MINHRNPIALAFSLSLLSACSLTPVAQLPAMDIPSTFAGAVDDPGTPVAPVPDPGRWQPAAPADGQHPSPWWQVFRDPVLVQLEEAALEANPDVSIAMARLQQARALTASSAAARLPQIDAGFGPSRQRSSGAAVGQGDGAPGTTQTLWRAQATVAYEVDLFGRVASGVDAARADEARQLALSHQMLLVVQADVATTYFGLRQLESEQRLLTETVTLREAALALLERQHALGAAARVLVDQAQTELFAARAEQLAVAQRQALTAHALATLLGKAPSAFVLAPLPLARVAIRLPAGLPSTLLERRPDVAAAERAMAAENARVGVANAAFFPALSLTGALGFASTDLGNLGNWSQRTFLLGPLVGTALSLPIFDGGRRKAGQARARAVYEERVGDYRKTVLQAFREVEDALLSMRTVELRVNEQQGAAQASSRVATAVNARFDVGDVDYLAVVDAQRTLLRSRQALIQSEGEQARASVDLVRALGGGWEVPRR